MTGISGFDEDVFVCVPTSLEVSLPVTTHLPSISMVAHGDYPLTVWMPSICCQQVRSQRIPQPYAYTKWSNKYTNTYANSDEYSYADSTLTATSTGASPTPTRHLRLQLPYHRQTRQVGLDLIFADGFESGNLSAWTSNTIDLGDLSVSTAAALIGSQGLQAVIDDANTIYVTDDSPNAETALSGPLLL